MFHVKQCPRNDCQITLESEICLTCKYFLYLPETDFYGNPIEECIYDLCFSVKDYLYLIDGLQTGL